MYVTCIRILPLHVTEEWNTIFRFAMISCGPFSVLWCPATCNTLCPTKSGPEGMFTSPPGGSMYTYMGRVWRSTTHPTLPRIGKRPRLWKVYEKLGPAHMLHVFAFLTPTVGWLTEYFIKYSSHVLPIFFKGANVRLTAELRPPWKLETWYF